MLTLLYCTVALLFDPTFVNAHLLLHSQFRVNTAVSTCKCHSRRILLPSAQGLAHSIRPKFNSTVCLSRTYELNSDLLRGACMYV